MSKARVQANKHQPTYQQNPAAAMGGAGIRTKKYGLQPKTYVSLAFKEWFSSQKKWIFVPLLLILINAIVSLTGLYPNIWIYIVVLVATGLYVLFGYARFWAVPQVDQNKAYFEKYSYEIDNRQILMKLNANEGGVIKWDMVKSVTKTADAYLLNLSVGQFIYLPLDIFTSEHDIKLFDAILRRKEFLPANA